MQDFFFYLKLGWEHIISLDALDHQLFVLALVVPFTLYDLKKILILVTAFTVGHSITLALSVLDYFRIPSEWVEFLIPVTIAVTTLENLLMKKTATYLRISYVLTLLFGLIHGMGFPNTARIMIAKEQDIAVPLLGFNIGLEVGQILVVVLVLVLGFLFTNILRVKKRDWLMFVSSGVFALALKMALERFP